MRSALRLLRAGLQHLGLRRRPVFEDFLDTALEAVREAGLRRDQVLSLAAERRDAEACQALQSTSARSECTRAAALLAECEAALQAFSAFDREVRRDLAGRDRILVARKGASCCL